jgi:glycosyltransferase involved in cell wall biosynthesis
MSNRLKLMVIAPWGERGGGAEVMLFGFLRHLDRSRFEPVVVFLSSGKLERDTAELGIRTIVLEPGRLRQPLRVAGTIRALIVLLRRERPSLLLNWSPKTQIYGGTAAALAGMRDRVLWWQHSVPKGHWLDRMATLLPAKAVGCSSQRSAEAQRTQWPQRPTFVVHPGVEERERLPDSEVLDLRRELGISSSASVAGIVGRLQPWKGQHHFIRAISEVRRRGHCLHGLVVGGEAFGLSTGYGSQLRDLVESLDLRDHVTFAGQVDDVRPYFQLMDLAISASAEEPFGIVLLEALALGIPVIAVSSAGPAEVLEPERSGLLVSSNHPHELAGAVESVLTDPHLRERLRSGGPERIREAFTVDHMTAKLEREIARLCPEAEGVEA